MYKSMLFCMLFILPFHIHAAQWTLSTKDWIAGSFEYSEATGYSNYTFFFNHLLIGTTYETNSDVVLAATPTHFGVGNIEGTLTSIFQNL